MLAQKMPGSGAAALLHHAVTCLLLTVFGDFPGKIMITQRRKNAKLPSVIIF